MNIYSLLKINRLIKSPILKGLGVWLLHISGKRYICVFFDPVLACNLRCRMCYFSDEEKRKNLKGHFNKEDLPRIAEVIFSKVLKLQIGCGAEPSIFKYNSELISLAKQYGVPYISYTTNANLLTEEEIQRLLGAGLNEFTISLHGVEKQTYENLMSGASYEKFLSTLMQISLMKNKYPDFKLRINFTVNEENIKELHRFFNVFRNIKIDILQVRPIQDIGGEIKFVENKLEFNAKFNEITLALKDECAKRNITYVAPLHLDENAKPNKSSGILDMVYWYISPRSFGNNIDWRSETFRQYCKRTHYTRHLFKRIFNKKQFSNNRLNYDIN